MSHRDAPVLDLDLWSDEALHDPYPLWARMRETGPVVRLREPDFYALPRYAETRAALADWRTFSSARGVMLNDTLNRAQAGATLHTDPPEHVAQRTVVGRPLTPRALKRLEEPFRVAAEEVVERLVARGSFDAAAELAPHLPLSIVSHQVGLPEEGRERMLAWAAAAFDSAGPMNARARAALPVLEEAVAYSYDPGLPGRLLPGGWAEGVYRAAAAGEVPVEKCPALLIDYWGPALDTTIAAMTSAIWLFGRNPDQWRLVREDPALLPHAVNEVVRLETPTPYFSRVATRDVELGGTVVPAGARVLVMYGSANRDERKWPDPERMDVRRAPVDHVGFGHGEHACLGQRLARLEIKAVLAALARRVERFEIGEVRRLTNNMLRKIERLHVTVR
ncbi:cytochrome P450 [Saccharothrix australiensis]|uniref:Cytochrome P450 n=1 Tax=Saccharothrix australiensis TaxID=2072 RepID=A0A495W0X1_9PSEU|nr:cytochrome P450 [Saccharothrix australiensis]RKT54657.1 cytochrome P450 [Saccharothrix australiensis]